MASAIDFDCGPIIALEPGRRKAIGPGVGPAVDASHSRA
jgi:hypothetical protein